MVSIPKRVSSETPTPPLPDDLMTVGEVAKRLNVNPTTCLRWIKNGTLSAISLPHKGERKAYRIRRSVYEQIVPPD